MRIIGLTGGIGAGKSTVTEMFRALGAAVIDTDEIAHSLSRAGQAGAAAVAEQFGPTFLLADGSIDRPKLRAHIFTDTEAKQKLEAALHPLIRQAAAQALQSLPPTTPYCLLAVPLLFETGAYADLIDEAWVVDCPEALQIQRVMARSRLSREEVAAIMAQQLPRQLRHKQADQIILNDGDLQQLTDRVKELHQKQLQAPESQQNLRQ